MQSFITSALLFLIFLKAHFFPILVSKILQPYDSTWVLHFEDYSKVGILLGMIVNVVQNLLMNL